MGSIEWDDVMTSDDYFGCMIYACMKWLGLDRTEMMHESLLLDMKREKVSVSRYHKHTFFHVRCK